MVSLDESECWALLRKAAVGRLAVVVNHRPEIFPITHIVDHATIVFHTAVGTKLEGSLGRDVAFEVDGYDPDTGEAWSVIVKGLAREIKQMYEALEALDLPCSRGTLRPSRASCGSSRRRSPAGASESPTPPPGTRRTRDHELVTVTRDSGRPIRVFLLDEHEVARRGLRELLEDEPDIEVVSEAESATATLRRIPALRVDELDIVMVLGPVISYKQHRRLSPASTTRPAAPEETAAI